MTKNQVVAIDIGSATVKIAYIEKTSEALHLINAGVIACTDPNNPQHISEAVRKLWNQLEIKQTFFNKHKMEVGIALPRVSVVTKRLTNLPPTTDTQLSSVVEMAAETELPFQTEESIFTYHDVRRTAETLSVELVSTRRDTVAHYIDALKEVGVTPSGVIPSMLAIATVTRNELSNSLARTIIVDVGAEHTDFCVMQGETLQFSRAFFVSGNQLTQTLMTERQLDAATAEQEKKHIPANQAPTRTWTRRFIGELERSIAAAEREINGDESQEVSEILLCGGGARVPELAEACQEQLQIPTRLWNPLYAGALDTSNASSSADIETDGDTLAVPLGVGLHILDVEEPVSLLPTEVGVKRVESSRKHQQLIAAGIAGFLILVIVLCGITWGRSQKSKEVILDKQIETFAGLQADANKQLALELILADKLSHQISPLDILHTLSTLFKDRTKVAWKTFEVNNLDDLEKTRISFSLRANSRPAINSMMGVLDGLKLFSKIEAGEGTVTGDERKPIFEVTIDCRLAPEAVQMFAQKRHPKPVFETKKPEPEDVDVSPPENSVDTKETSDEKNKEDR